MRREHIERLLPAAFQRSVTGHGVLDALLAVMQGLHEPSETVLSHVDDLVSAYRAPDVLVPFLVNWVAFDHLGLAPAGLTTAAEGATAGGATAGGRVPAGRLRDLIANAAALAATRGTAAGLCRLLATVTGVDGYRVDEPANRPFHLVVRVPPAAAADLELIRRIVAAEKPAATTFEVVLDASKAVN
jgi:phage tail-like protein